MKDETVGYHFQADLNGEDRREEVVKIIQDLKKNWSNALISTAPLIDLDVHKEILLHHKR